MFKLSPRGQIHFRGVFILASHSPFTKLEPLENLYSIHTHNIQKVVYSLGMILVTNLIFFFLRKFSLVIISMHIVCHI